MHTLALPFALRHTYPARQVLLFPHRRMQPATSEPKASFTHVEPAGHAGSFELKSHAAEHMPPGVKSRITQTDPLHSSLLVQASPMVGPQPTLTSISKKKRIVFMARASLPRLGSRGNRRAC